MRAQQATRRRRERGQRLRIETSEAAVDCESEGLLVDPGDEIEVFVLGVVE